MALFAGPASSVDYPIERAFPGIRIRIHADGTIGIPYNSLAFQIWRSRSSEALPDTAFAYHYLSEEEIYDQASRRGIHLTERELRLAQKNETPPAPRVSHRLSIPEELSQGEIANFPDLLDRKLNEPGVPHAFKLELKFLAFEKGGERFAIVEPKNNQTYPHAFIEMRILHANPGAQCIGVGYVSIHVSRDPNGGPVRLEFPANEQTLFRRFHPTVESIEQAFKETVVFHP